MKKQLSGFTLIELLFVVAVLGVLSTTGVLFYQQRLQNQKVEKTVSQMQQWMQAGMAYYVKNGKWPAGAQVLVTDGYMPEGAVDNSPWCKSGCYSVAPDAMQKELLRVTALNLPSDAISKAIGARLPYSVGQTASSVAGLVNVPLAALDKKTPDMILMGARSFTVGGMRGYTFRRYQPAGGNASAAYAIAEIALGKAPSCDRYKDFVPSSSAAITHYESRNSQNTQQPVFSNVMAVSYPIGSTGDVGVLVSARPQEITKLELGSWFQQYFSTEMTQASLDNLVVRGVVYFFCCRKGTTCQNLNGPNPPSGLQTSSDISNISNLSHPPGFRF